MLPDRFFAMLNGERSLVVPSAWDAVSAQVLERAGARAIAIQVDDILRSLGQTSWANGPDEVVSACVRVRRAVTNVPVVVDLNTTPRTSGRCASPDPTHLIRALVAGGIAGITVSGDAMVNGRIPWDNVLRPVSLRDSARLFIEARVDPPVIDTEIGGHKRRRQYEYILRLAHACAAAGADGVLLSGCYAADAIRLVRDVSIPVSIDVGDGWAAPVQMFARAGVRSVRLGRGPLRAALGLIERVAAEALGRGSYDLMSRHISETASASRFA